MRTLEAIFVSVMLLLPAAAANAQQNGNAAMCQPTAASRAFVERNQYGIANISPTTSAQVYCPVDVAKDPAMSTFQMVIYARNLNVELFCRLHLMDDIGNDLSAPETHLLIGSNSNGPHPLTFSTMPATPPANAVFFCSIPPLSNGTPSYISWFGWTP